MFKYMQPNEMTLGKEENGDSDAYADEEEITAV